MRNGAWAATAVFAAFLAGCSEGTTNPDHPDASAIADASSADGSAEDAAPDAANLDATGFPDAMETADAGHDAGTPMDAMEPADTGAGMDATAGFTVSGNLSFDWVPALDDFTEGGVKLDYAQRTTRPIRRVIVEARDNGTIVAAGRSDDNGHYSLAIPGGHTVQIRVRARMEAQAYRADGIAPDNCAGGSFDVSVIDNTRNRAEYFIDLTPPHSADGTADLEAKLERTAGRYTSRTAAPFNLLDTVLREMELVCSAEPAANFPRLWLNWSANNSTVDGNVQRGEIGTSYHDVIGGESNIFILGKDNDDSDEYDDHVVAHETGHYVETWRYRSDSSGGEHGDLDMLEPAVAFSEGFGNAISGMVWEDPIYVDTSGDQQVGGFAFNVATAPVDDDRGLYSENTNQYLLWALFDAADPQPNKGGFQHLDAVLKNDQATTPAMTTALSFAAYYNARFGGAAENLRRIWETDLDQPYDALCVGVCAGQNDTADPFDSQNLIGQRQGTGGASLRHYPIGSMSTFDAGFWQVFRTLSVGANASTGHDQTRFGMYGYPDNKWGAIRNYRYTATQAGMATVTANQLHGGSCGQDVLDMFVYDRGSLVGSDDSTSGCPTVTFPTQADTTYVVQLDGLTQEVNSWTVTVQQQKRHPPVTVALDLPKTLIPGVPAIAAVRLSSARASDLSFRARGLDGVSVERGKGSELRVRVPKDHAGAVAIDVRGQVQGRRFSFTKSFRAGAPGTEPLLLDWPTLAPRHSDAQGR
ncbi:MAG: hypothetical protein U1E65_22425 [Myxococcota bacterium]